MRPPEGFGSTGTDITGPDPATPAATVPSPPWRPDEVSIKHLELIQGVVARMASQSFVLRGWSVTLVAGMTAFAAKDADTRPIAVSYLPIAAFWLLDGYYLSQERRYRALYRAVTGGTAEAAGVPPLGLDPDPVAGPEDRWGSALFSRPLLAFHGALALTVAIIMVALRSSNISSSSHKTAPVGTPGPKPSPTRVIRPGRAQVKAKQAAPAAHGGTTDGAANAGRKARQEGGTRRDAR